MTLLERIKVTIFGDDPAPRPTAVEQEKVGAPYETDGFAAGYRSDVSTPADDPIMDDIAAAGVQPVSKPLDIEKAQNPERRPLH